jgi:hypothetical protein
MDDEETFFKYFRLSQYHFNESLEKIQVVIFKEGTVSKEAVTPNSRTNSISFHCP